MKFEKRCSSGQRLIEFAFHIGSYEAAQMYEVFCAEGVKFCLENTHIFIKYLNQDTSTSVFTEYLYLIDTLLKYSFIDSTIFSVFRNYICNFFSKTNYFSFFLNKDPGTEEFSA
jgi:hypothetical protein